MKAALGWTQFSREALRKAEASVLEQEQGVRDEIGFLLLHQAYADRFFPGTSVLQTRLRYILFVPWMYERIARTAHQRSIDELLREEEMRLIARLRAHYQALGSDNERVGIIGSRSHAQGRLTTQPPSMIYWTALGRWGLLKRGVDQVLPARSRVHGVFRHRHVTTRIREDDDRQPLFEESPLFVALPDPPPEWEKYSLPLSFAFPDDKRNERGFVLRHLVGVAKPGTHGSELSLLARLAERDFDSGTSEVVWDKRVRSHADKEDQHALVRARQASSLAAVGRGVYAALVEHVRATEDGLETEDIHRSYLTTLRATYEKEARALDIGAMRLDAPGLETHITAVLLETQRWLASSQPVSELWDVYAQAEVRRKGARARLAPNYGGTKRRAEWFPDQHTLAYPLHYRWPNVRRLLKDLRGEP